MSKDNSSEIVPKKKYNPLDNLPPEKRKGYLPGHPKYGGKKKGYVSPTAILRDMMAKKVDYKDPKTRKIIKKCIGEVIILKHLENASKGDRASVEDILDRIDGKALDRKEITGADGGPLMIEWEK